MPERGISRRDNDTVKEVSLPRPATYDSFDNEKAYLTTSLSCQELVHILIFSPWRCLIHFQQELFQ